MTDTLPCDPSFDAAIEALWDPDIWRRACPATAAHVARQAREQPGPLRAAFERYDTVLLPWVGIRFRDAPVKVGVYLREYPFPTLRGAHERVLDGDRGGPVPADVMRQAFWHNRETCYSEHYRNTVEETLALLPRILEAMRAHAGRPVDPFPARPALLDHLVLGDWVKLFAPFHAPDKPGRSSWHKPEMYRFAADRFVREVELLGLDWVIVLGRAGADDYLARPLRAWLAGGEGRQAVLLPHPAQHHLRAAVNAGRVDTHRLSLDAAPAPAPSKASPSAPSSSAASPSALAQARAGGGSPEGLRFRDGQERLLVALQACLERARGTHATPDDTPKANYRGLAWPDVERDYLQLQARGVVVKLLGSTWPGAPERVRAGGWEIGWEKQRHFCFTVPNDTPDERLDRLEALLRGG